MSHKGGRSSQGPGEIGGIPPTGPTTAAADAQQQQQQQQQLQLQRGRRSQGAVVGSTGGMAPMDLTVDPPPQQPQQPPGPQPQADLPALPAPRERASQATSRTRPTIAPAAVCAPASLALAGLMPGRHGTPGMAPGTVLDHPVFLRAGAVTYVIERVIGNGSFGVVLQARVDGTNEIVAIKRVLQDRRYKNRELQMMKMFRHPNIVELKNSFYGTGAKPDEVYLNLAMEYLPETVYKATRDYTRRRQMMPLMLIRLYAFQLCRALAYMHALGACHRDIKPQNLLVDQAAGTLKLCDFGSAKVLQKGEANVAYICSRYYRAPELIFGATNYTTAIDVWSMGCVFAELFLGQPLFPGDSGVDQLVEIIKVLGAPSHEQVLSMNKSYPSYNFPDIKPHPLSKIFRSGTPPEALDMLARILVYMPNKRPHAIELCAHPFFNELKDPAARLPDGNLLPRQLFDFTPEELSAASAYGVRERLTTPTPPQASSPLQLPHLGGAAPSSQQQGGDASTFDDTMGV